jgi:3-dehydroquinate dehydratase / shikimate dehydrogenase
MNNGLICVSVCAEDENVFLEKIERAAQIADIVELRLDCLKEFDLSVVSDRLIFHKLTKLKEGLKKPFVITYRPAEEGGFRRINLDKNRIPFWENQQIDLSSYADFVDCEWELLSNLTYSWRFYDNTRKSKIICSFHRFEDAIKDFKNLQKIFEEMARLWVQGKLERREPRQADVIKIAVQSDDAIDGLAVMKLLERARADDKNIIPIAMGEYGMWTRILGLSRGAFMTFASLDDESATAPGQLTVQEMIDVYRVKELDANTEIYGLVAGSTAHSVSPQMHNAAFKYHNLNAVYVPFAVKNLEEFMRRMVNPQTREIDWKLCGLSVTLPHKVEIMKYLDFVDETAQKIGAVNTVKIEGNRLLGFNTDAEGFIEPLKNSYGDVRGCKVAILGAGGAARACVYALKQEGAEVTVFARDLEKAKSLAADFGVQISDFKFEDFSDFDILVNATPLGMKKGGLENEAPAKTVQLGGLDLVYDLIYNPFTTKLMREAQAVFVPTLGGLAMLVAQAMAQQKIWTGLDAPMKEMSAAALKRLE